MSNAAKKRNYENSLSPARPVLLVDILDERDESSKSWFWSLVDSILDSPDYDLSQFERLELKKTRRLMERERFF